MNKDEEFKVGDEVRRSGWECGYTILALDDTGHAWIRSEHSRLGLIVQISSLTRIEPEPVVLTPKYAVEQRVRTAQNKTETVIKGILITYETTNLGTWDEAELEPVPEPCPECKGSGKASEGGA